MTHLLFMDDVILMGTGSLQEWAAFDVILETFCKASGMCISLENSIFLYNNIAASYLLSFSRILPYQKLPILTGFKYLGFFIKPLGYRTRDWNWLVQKYEKKSVFGPIRCSH